MISVTFDMRVVPADFSLYDAALVAVMSHCSTSTVSVVRAVVKSWYDDEHDGFNAEHIDVGGQG